VQSGGERQQGSALGNLRVRRGRRREQVVQIERPRIRKARRPGILILLGGFALLIAFGTFLLWLPIASEQEGPTPLLRALFTATSAVCVTGLVLVDTRENWTTFGHIVIIGLIQLGGLGFMTSATLLLLILGRRLSVSQRVITSQLSGRIGNESLGALIKRITLVTLACEGIGALLLTAFFSWHHNLSLETIWRAIFTSISAFNNAGFDLEGGGRSLSLYSGNPGVLITVAALATIGGLGYAVLWDVRNVRGWHHLNLNSKIVLLTYAGLMVAGTVVIFFGEAFRDGPLGQMPWPQALLSAFAESSYARTSGFTAFDLGAIDPGILMFIAALMFIGGASASTAGGIKVTTFSTLFFAIVTSLRGEEHVHAFGREIPWRHVNRALAVALLSVAFVFFAGFLLHLTTPALTHEVLFEAVSAFATTGLSTGITGSLDTAGQLIIIISMYLGRLGPLTIAIALATRFKGPERLRYPEAELNIG